MTYQNLSTLDRSLRLIVGLTMLAAGWIDRTGSVWQVALQIFGWVPMATGVAGWDPIYSLMGFSTRRREIRDRDDGGDPPTGA